eukprot:TRINITY_DN9680_c0_g1_i2.p2 TRINITY_DN9680_c0_g1~~TRINITY_DN9680_c0_g1_i2.p2  ORF type:complete len:159 (-),score=21.17 TRINITY_DN9680_c0_g1_i2:494-970(-)
MFVFVFVGLQQFIKYIFFFFNDTATTEIYTLHIVGSVRCVQETGVKTILYNLFLLWILIKHSNSHLYSIQICGYLFLAVQFDNSGEVWLQKWYKFFLNAPHCMFNESTGLFYNIIIVLLRIILQYYHNNIPQFLQDIHYKLIWELIYRFIIRFLGFAL